MKQTLNVTPSLSQYITENDIQIGYAIVEISIHTLRQKKSVNLMLGLVACLTSR